MTDFGTVSPGLRPREPRNKAAEDAKARLNALPAECAGWKDRLTMHGLEALAVVVRANKAAGGPCMVHRSDIASAIGITADGADRLLGRLVDAGAVERTNRLMQAPLFRAVTDRPAAPARKADPSPVAPEPRRRAASVTDARLRAGLVGMRNHEEPAKLELRAGIVGANPRR